MRPLLLAALIVPNIAYSEPLPQDYFPRLGNVVNVADGDALNIRLKPHHLSEAIGTLPARAVDVEVVNYDETGKWALVNSREASGYVRRSYFEVPEQLNWHTFSRPLECAGTEPFWSFRITTDAQLVRFDGVDASTTSLPVEWSSDIAARLGGTIGMGGGSDQLGFSALVENELCHDGMSDREYALRVRLFMHMNGETFGYDGCCSLFP